MNIFVYSDESGVFDKTHNDYFVFGGMILISGEELGRAQRKYVRAENEAKKALGLNDSDEAKATVIDNKWRSKLFRATTQEHRFGVIVDQKKVHDKIFDDKKTKQRYLDFVYKIAVKRALQNLIDMQLIIPDDVTDIRFFVDEHTTATNGRYELCEALEQELKLGTHNFNTMTFYPPLFPKMKKVSVTYCNSSTEPLVRASDIIANKLYYYACRQMQDYSQKENLFIIRQP